MSEKKEEESAELRSDDREAGRRSPSQMAQDGGAEQGPSSEGPVSGGDRARTQGVEGTARPEALETQGGQAQGNEAGAGEESQDAPKQTPGILGRIAQAFKGKSETEGEAEGAGQEQGNAEASGEKEGTEEPTPASLNIIIMAGGFPCRVVGPGRLSPSGMVDRLGVTVRGESILSRTMRMLKEHAPAARVTVAISPDMLRPPGRVVEVDPKTLLGRNIAAVALGSPTLVLLGDVVWSGEVLRKLIVDARKRNDWAVYGRKGPNRVTGKAFGALFACFYVPRRSEFRRALKLRDLERLGAPFIETDPGDYTDDIDTRRDVLRGVPRLERHIKSIEKARMYNPWADSRGRVHYRPS